MTFTGKLLVLLILVMSVTFMAFSVMTYATHRNWKELVENANATPTKPLGLLKQLENREKEIENLEIEKEQLEQALREEQEDRRRRISQLETTIAMLQKDLTDLETKNETLQKSEREKVAAFDALQETLNKRREELDAIRKEIVDVHRAREEHFANVIKLRDEVNQLKGELDRLKIRRDQLVEQIAKQDRILAVHGLSRHTPENYEKPPRVEGRITAFNTKEKLVEISIGSDDGILRGHELEVFRLTPQPRYLGKIKVLNTHPDRAVAKVVPGTEKGAFERNDHVATTLKQ